MKQSETVKELAEALVQVQTEINNLYPSSKGYGYDYVPLNIIIDMLKTVLPKYNLAYIQLPYGGQSGTTVGLTTRIIHKSGEWLEETAEFPVTDMKGVNATQKAGAAITYFRRYALLSAFGITGDKDVDANDKAFPPSPSNGQNNGTPNNQEEIKKMKDALLDYINSEVLSGPGADKAKSYMDRNDISGMKRTLDWCKSQKKVS